MCEATAVVPVFNKLFREVSMLQFPKAGLAGLISIVAVWGHSAASQDVLTTPENAAIFSINLCMFPSTENIPELLTEAKSKAADSGLPVVVENDDSGMYGSPADAFVMVSKTIDSLTCLVKMPPPRGSFQTYKIIEAGFDAQFRNLYPSYKEDIDDDPSPHVDGHDWIVRTLANDTIIITIDWGTEDGITIAGVTKKEYD